MTRKKLALCITAGLLVIVLLVGLLTNWFGFYGPAAKIVSASQKVLETQNFSAFIELKAGPLSLSGTLQVQIDTKQRTLSAALIDEEGDIKLAIYKNHLIFSVGFLTYAKDIHVELDRFFDMLEDNQKTDWAQLLQNLDKDLYDRIGDNLDFRAVDGCMLQLYRKLNSERWLKKNAGWSEEKQNDLTIHRFKPDSTKFLQSCLKCFKKAFRDHKGYDALMAELDDAAPVDLQIELGIQNGLLDRFHLSVDDCVKIQIDFTDIGVTTICEDNLGRILERAIKLT